MYCPQCGARTETDSRWCAECGRTLVDAEGESRSEWIPNYLAQAILVTVLCCVPLGILAIVYAARVNRQVIDGDYQLARESSTKAKMWCWGAFWLGIVWWVFFVMASLAEIAKGY